MTGRALLLSGDAPRVMYELEMGLSALGGRVVHAPQPDTAQFDTLVHVVMDDGAPRTLESISESEWVETAEEGLLGALRAGQSAFGALTARGGSIVFVTESAALVGAAGRVVAATVSEGVRALAKAMARQWGVHGIRVNCVAVGSQSVEKAALDRPPSLADDVAPVIAMLAGDGAHFVTGSTIVVDGGVVMLP